MTDSANSFDAAAASPSNSEFFSPEYLARRRRALEVWTSLLKM
jgi:hypothetical protein